MRRVLVALLVLTACGSDTRSSGSTTSQQVTTIAPTSTSRVVSGNSGTSATSTTSTIVTVGSPAGQLMLCKAVLGSTFAAEVAIDPSWLATAQKECDGADAKLDVDLSFAALALAQGTFDAAAQQRLQDAVDVFVGR